MNTDLRKMKAMKEGTVDLDIKFVAKLVRQKPQQRDMTCLYNRNFSQTVNHDQHRNS